MMDADGEFDVGGRRLRIRNLDRVVFPRAGTTKGHLLDYYVRIADTMLPHLRDRLLHLHRYPEGVEGPRFWQKACPEHRRSGFRPHRSGVATSMRTSTTAS
jgi:bifunctional non-homologous end joining protein LigD